ncbi:Serine/threonine protein kinase ppk15 [Entamoeba marina]
MSHRKKHYISFIQTTPFKSNPDSPFVPLKTCSSSSCGTPPKSPFDIRFVVQATTALYDVLKECNSSFDFSQLLSRPITSPSTPTRNNNKDNSNNDLILYTEQLLGTGVDPSQCFGKQLNSQYRVISLLGQGAFGQVVKCYDEQCHRFVAIKVLKNRGAYMRQAMLEIAIVQLLNDKFDKDGKAHTLRIYDHFIYYNHVCIVTELLGMNLYELLSQKSCKGLSFSLAVNILKQLAESLSVLYRNNIVHCDLKPENILLVDNTSNIRLIDFGSSCFENSTLYTYIQSRHYRSPEVILGIKYTSGIDMWSFGCIAAELILGIPIFPGSSEYNQLERIIKMIGMPPRDVLDRGTNTRNFFNLGINGWEFKTRDEYEQEKGVVLQPNKNYHQYRSLDHFAKTVPLHSKSKNQDRINSLRFTLLDFLKRTLCWDPEKRITPSQALKHPFLMNKRISDTYQPHFESPPKRVFPGNSTLSADDALKMICPPTTAPAKFKYQTFTTSVYYQIFISALEKGIVLNILNSNPFVLQPMTPPVLAWEQVEMRKREQVEIRKREQQRIGKDIKRKRHDTHRNEGNGTYTEKFMIVGPDSFNGNSWRGETVKFSPAQTNYGRSPGQSWSKKYSMVIPKDT